jgi:uncharacterized membrane protein
MESWLVLGYFAVAAVVCIATWIDCSGTYYVNGPPSGVLAGLFWPLILLAIFLVLAGILVRRAAHALSWRASSSLAPSPQDEARSASAREATAETKRTPPND